MTDQLPCPICHNVGAHKLDCQNAVYVSALEQYIKELEDEMPSIAGAVGASMYGKRIRKLKEIYFAKQENLDHAINENRKAKQRISELEQQVAEYEARDSRYWHSVQKRTDGQAERIRQLETHLEHWLKYYTDGIPSDELHELHLDTLEALEAAPELNTASPETLQAIKCVTGQNND